MEQHDNMAEPIFPLLGAGQIMMCYSGVLMPRSDLGMVRLESDIA